jgi:hypothetical protein
MGNGTSRLVPMFFASNTFVAREGLNSSTTILGYACTIWRWVRAIYRSDKFLQQSKTDSPVNKTGHSFFSLSVLGSWLLHSHLLKRRQRLGTHSTPSTPRSRTRHPLLRIFLLFEPVRFIRVDTFDIESTIDNKSTIDYESTIDNESTTDNESIFDHCPLQSLLPYLPSCAVRSRTWQREC